MNPRRTACALLLLIACSGCTAPETWETFQVDYDLVLEGHDETDVENSDRYRPQSAQSELTPRLSPDGSLTLSLEEAAVFALAGNRDLAVAQLSPVIVGAFELVERGIFDPEVFAELQYSEETSSETARATGSQFSVDGRDMSGLLGLRQTLPGGTSLEATLEQSRSASNRAPEQQEARAGLSVTQALLRGFGPAVNLAGVRQAELDTLASVWELRGFTEALLADTEIAYWSYILAREEIAIFERSLEIARQQQFEVEQRIEVGDLADIEAAAARAEVALREQALIDARSALEAERLRLLRLINPSADGSLESPLIATTDPRLQPQTIDDVQDRLALADRKRPDLNEARLRLEQNRLETIVTRNGLLPRLELFIALGKTGFDDTFSRSFKQMDEDTYDLSAGVRFSQFIDNRSARGLDVAARASRQQQAQAVESLRQLIRQEILLAVNEVRRAAELISATAVTRELQEQTLRAEQERFDVGSSTALQVAQAQRDLLEAEIAEVSAIVNYRIALTNLYLAEGSLLERRGISIPADTPDQK